MKNNYEQNIGKILRETREKLNLTQLEVSKKIGIGRDAIIRIEKGNKE